MEIKIYNVIYWKLYGKELEPQSCEHIYHTKLKDAKNCMSTIRERRDIKNRQYFEVIIFPNTLEYSKLPQNRERLYIVGFRKDTKFIDNFSFPNPVKTRKQIIDLLQKPDDIENKYYYKGTPLYNKISHFNFKTNIIYQWRRKYIRENKNGVCPTLTANMGTGGHNVPIVLDKRGIRKLTPRECFRFQGFPEKFKLPEISDSHLYKQVGNSVSVPVIKRIALNISKAIQ